jgi:hypothetical protein
MIELISTTDPVRLSFVRSVLAQAGIEALVFDANAPWPGAIPNRLMVADADAPRARQLLADMEEDGQIR